MARSIADAEPEKPREPLPFFLDPEQVKALSPEIDWDERVGERIRKLLEMGRLASDAQSVSA